MTTTRDAGRTLRSLWQRGQRGWPERFPIAQFPNAPLIVAFGGWAVAAATDGSLHDDARGTFYAGLAAWGWIELTDGVNWVRRVVGAGGLVYVIAQIGDALG